MTVYLIFINIEIGLNAINGYLSAMTIYYHVIIIKTDYIKVRSYLEPAGFEPNIIVALQMIWCI